MRPRILVVDDDPLYTEAATTILARDGRVEVVGCAKDGVATLVAAAPAAKA